MKTRLLGLGVLAFCLVIQAQPLAPSVPLDSSAERARIEADRAREQARFEQEEAGCYQRFAVNDCLRDVKARRRPVLEELRRQEIILNEEDRKKRAAEVLRRVDEKTSAPDAQDAADKRAAGRQAHQERQERAAQKPVGGGKNEPGQGTAVPQLRPSPAGSASAESRAQEKKAFDEKQQRAQERKAQRDKALSKKSGPPAQHLPVPP